MTEKSHTCSRCGETLSEDAAGGLCPRCLMAMNFDSRTMPEGEELPHMAPFSPEELAEKFPQYEILECLGRGGMGVVYKARQKSLDRIVAIKILPPERVGEVRFSERFAIEAATLAKLSHPNIVTVHDFGIADSQPSTLDSQPLYYIVMEYVDGVNLRDLLREGKLEPQQALAIVPPICDALQYAHDKGIVHRDIKPENLLLDKDSRLKIADFGIASLMGAAGEIAGTPPYMAPEQNGAKTDHRADIYALGVVLYEMLTGERPGKELVAPSRKVQIDVRLDEMVLRALEKEPERRYQTAGEFRTVVETMSGRTGESWGRQRTSAGFPAWPMGYEYRSKRSFRGLPWLHVANGIDPQTGGPRHARGIVALGGVATGWLAIGGRAYGGVALGGIAVGGIAMGGVAAGLVSFGGFTLGLLLALGGFAIAPMALGGMAIGYVALGGEALGVHVVSGSQPETKAIHQLYRNFQPLVFALVGGFWISLMAIFAGISAWAKRQPYQSIDGGDPVDAGHVPTVVETIQSSPPPMRPMAAVPLGKPPGMSRRWWWVFPMMVPVSVMLALMAGMVFNYVVPKKYEAEATIEFRPLETPPLAERSPAISMIRIQSSESLAEVSRKLDLPHRWMLKDYQVIPVLKSMIIVQPIRGTDLVSIRVRHTSPQDAVDVANAVVEVATADPQVRVFLHDQPVFPQWPVSPNLTLNLVAAGACGLFASPVLGWILAAILHRLFPVKPSAASGNGSAARVLTASNHQATERRDATVPSMRSPEKTPLEEAAHSSGKRKQRRKKFSFRLHDRTPSKATLLGVAALCLFVGCLIPVVGEPLWRLFTSEGGLNEAASLSSSAAAGLPVWLWGLCVGLLLVFVTMVFSLVLVFRSNGSGASKFLAAFVLLLLFGVTMAVLVGAGLYANFAHQRELSREMMRHEMQRVIPR